MIEAATLHRPVLLEETLAALAPRAGGRYLDGTTGLGGHAEAILRASGPDGRLLGLDLDPDALAAAGTRLAPFGDRAVLAHRGYEEAARAAAESGFVPLSGIVLDLGVSSLQLDHPERGFSFRLNGPIDMRFDPTSGEPSAGDLVNTAPEEELADLIWRLGEEPAARRMAWAIVHARPLRTTSELAAVIRRAAGRRGTRISRETRTFQALRIAVNHELDHLRAVLEQAPALLEAGGRLVVISFHSLEDRIVKQFMQRESRDCVCPPGLPECRCGHRRIFSLLTRAALTPSTLEQADNPRSRSAKLRAAIRVEPRRGGSLMALVHGPIPGRQGRSLTARLGSALAVLAAIGLLVAAMFLPVVQSSDATSTGYTIRQHQQELAQLQAQIHQTEASVAELGAMSRIETNAARLGMVQPTARPLSVSVSTPPTAQVFLPRRYLPQPAQEPATATPHGLLWSLVHLLARH